jgi:hypothetical protein
LTNNDENIDPILLEELFIVLKYLKNKTPGSPQINIGLIKLFNPTINKTVSFDRHVPENRLYTI